MNTEIVNRRITELSEPLEQEQPTIDATDTHATTDRIGRIRYFDCYVPDGYKINFRGVLKEIKSRVKKGELQSDYDKICSTRLMPTGLYTDIDTKTDILELTFLSHCALEVIHVPSVAMLGSKEWRDYIRANNYGRLDVLDEELKETRKFLQAAIKANLGWYKGPEGTMFREGEASARVGWQGNEFKRFVIGNTSYSNLGIEPAVFMDIKNVGANERLAPKGTLQGWLMAIRPVIEYHKLRFAMYYTVGSLLLGILKSPNSVFTMIGDTSIGKTFTLMILASMFGNPDPEGRGLIIPGDISLTALNAIITTITDVPVFIDEIGKMKIDSRDALIYAIGNGKESTRGKTDGSLRSDRMIRCNAIITGEVESVTEFSNNGAHAREFSSSQRPIPLIDGRIVVDTKRTITENYGQILPLVLEKIFSLGESGIKKVFDAALNRLYETTPDPIMRRKSEYFAVSEVGGVILESVFQDLGIKPFDSSEIVDEMWNEFVLEDPDVPLEVKALDDVQKWAMSKPRNFLVNDQQPLEDHPDDLFGWFVCEKNQSGCYTSEKEFLDLNKLVLEKFLRDSNYKNPGRVLVYWRDHSITECDINKKNGKMCSDGKKRLRTFSVYHYYKYNQAAEKKPIIRIKIDKIKELLEFAAEQDEPKT